MQRRLNQIQRDPENVVYVAAFQDGYGIGWLHAFVCRYIESDSRAEIGGLIVDEQHHRSGAGRLLMRHAEQWARESGCDGVNLRTNIVRNEARAFYQSLGYDLIKTQHAFRKVL